MIRTIALLAVLSFAADALGADDPFVTRNLPNWPQEPEPGESIDIRRYARSPEADLTLLDQPMPRLLRCYRRCEREHGTLPTPTPTHSPKPTPTPTVAPACADSDRFSKISDGHYRKEVQLEIGVARTLCVDLPAPSVPFPFFTIYTINRGNVSCSNLEMTAITPHGAYTTDTGPAPVLRPNIDPGRWFVKLYLPWGCTKYEFNIQYPR